MALDDINPEVLRQVMSELGKRGAAKSSRTRRLPARRRRQIARQAAQARWRKAARSASPPAKARVQPRGRVIGITTPFDRSQEMTWLKEHAREYAGQWVALDGDRLIAGGWNAKEVFEAARRSGVYRPLIVQVESPDQPPFGGW